MHKPRIAQNSIKAEKGTDYHEHFRFGPSEFIYESKMTC